MKVRLCGSNFVVDPLQRNRLIIVQSINVKETDNEYKLSIAAPGLENGDFNIQLNNGILTVSVEKEESKNTDEWYNRREYNYSSRTRSFSLPEDANEHKISAEYKNGELRIDVPSHYNLRANLKPHSE